MTTLLTIDQQIEMAIKPAADALMSMMFFDIPLAGGAAMPFIVAWLFAGALFTTLYFRFVNLRFFAHGMGLAHPKNDDPNAPGNLSNYEALATCLSGTIGLGNIAGVAVALSVGGPGAAIWLCIMGFLGMSTKFAEATLSVKYRTKLENGEYVGGPMYFLKDGFAEKGWPRLGAALATLFAICCIAGTLGGGNMFQANQTFQQFVVITGGEAGWLADKGWLFGLGLAALVGCVIIGGLNSIAAVASRITPFMGLLYIVAGLIVIIVNAHNIMPAIGAMLRGAFTLEAGVGGLLGAIIWGVRRAIFSNEAGIGSAGIMHAATRTHYPASVGMVAMLGAFFDTVVVCMITALVIMFSGVLDTQPEGMAGVALTSQAFATVLPWFPYVLTFVVFLFAYSTLITWFYYGLNAAKYLAGDSKIIDWGFKVLFLACVVLGSAVSLSTIIDLADGLYFAMAIPNLIGVYVLAPVVKKEFDKYLQALKK